MYKRQIKTLHPLLDAGNYSGPWYIIIDNEDPTAETYYQLYGRDRVLIVDNDVPGAAVVSLSLIHI